MNDSTDGIPETNRIPLVDHQGKEIPEFARNCKEVMEVMGKMAVSVALLHQHPNFKLAEKVSGQHNEMHSNIQLAYRHLEDAQHRLGRAVEAFTP